MEFGRVLDSQEFRELGIIEGFLELTMSCNFGRCRRIQFDRRQLSISITSLHCSRRPSVVIVSKLEYSGPVICPSVAF